MSIGRWCGAGMLFAGDASGDGALGRPLLVLIRLVSLQSGANNIVRDEEGVEYQLVVGGRWKLQP